MQARRRASDPRADRSVQNPKKPRTIGRSDTQQMPKFPVVGLVRHAAAETQDAKGKAKLLEYCIKFDGKYRNAKEAGAPRFLDPTELNNTFDECAGGLRTGMHDSHEYWELLINLLHEAILGETQMAEASREVGLTAAECAEKATQFWRSLIETAPSPILERLGVLTSRTNRCTAGCNYSVTQFQQLYSIMVNLPSGGSQCSLQSLLDHYCDETEMEVQEKDSWRCERCAGPAKRPMVQEQLWRLPEHLLVLIKRMKVVTGRDANGKVVHIPEKLHTAVEVNMDEVLLVSNGFGEKQRYNVTLAALHYGDTLAAGHYITLSKEGGEWWLINDHRITQMLDPQILPRLYESEPESEKKLSQVLYYVLLEKAKDESEQEIAKSIGSSGIKGDGGCGEKAENMGESDKDAEVRLGGAAFSKLDAEQSKEDDECNDGGGSLLSSDEYPFRNSPNPAGGWNRSASMSHDVLSGQDSGGVTSQKSLFSGSSGDELIYSKNLEQLTKMISSNLTLTTIDKKSKLTIDTEESDFIGFITENNLCADTTPLIMKVLGDRGKHHLFLFPLEWLKTFNLTMLDTLLGIVMDDDGKPCMRIEANSGLFSTFLAKKDEQRVKRVRMRDRGFRNKFPRMAFFQDPSHMDHLGKYPVVFIDLNFVCSTFAQYVKQFTAVLSEVFERYDALRDGLPAQAEAARERGEQALARNLDKQAVLFCRYSLGDPSDKELRKGLAFLAECLENQFREYTKNKPLIVIDNYDQGLLNAHFGGADPNDLKMIKDFLTDVLTSAMAAAQVVMAGRVMFSGLPVRSEWSFTAKLLKVEKKPVFVLHSRLTGDDFAKCFGISGRNFDTFCHKLQATTKPSPQSQQIVSELPPQLLQIASELSPPKLQIASEWLGGYTVRRIHKKRAVTFVDEHNISRPVSHDGAAAALRTSNPATLDEYYDPKLTMLYLRRLIQGNPISFPLVQNEADGGEVVGAMIPLQNIFHFAENVIPTIKNLVKNKSVSMELAEFLTLEDMDSLYQFASTLDPTAKPVQVKNVKKTLFSYLYHIGVLDAQEDEAKRGFYNVRVANKSQAAYLEHMLGQHRYKSMLRREFIPKVCKVSVKLVELTARCYTAIEETNNLDGLQARIKPQVDALARSLEDFCSLFAFGNFNKGIPGEFDYSEDSFHRLFDFALFLASCFYYIGSERYAPDTERPKASDASDSAAMHRRYPIKLLIEHKRKHPADGALSQAMWYVDRNKPIHGRIERGEISHILFLGLNFEQITAECEKIETEVKVESSYFLWPAADKKAYYAQRDKLPKPKGMKRAEWEPELLEVDAEIPDKESSKRCINNRAYYLAGFEEEEEEEEMDFN